MKIGHLIEQGSELSLESQLKMLSLESNFTANFADLFRETIPSFLTNLIHIKQNITATEHAQAEVVYKLNKKERQAIEIAKHLSFLTFGDRIVFVPESFAGNLLNYTKVLKAIVSEAYKVQLETMAEYNTILSSFLTNRDDKISLKDHTAFFTKIKDERERFTKELSVFRASQVGGSKAQIKNIMDRMGDLEFIIKEAKDLASSHEQARLNQLKESVSQSIDLLNLIIDNVKTGKIQNVSANATMNIAQGAYEVAKYVEFISIVYFDISVLLNCIDKLLDVIVNADK